MSVEDGISSPLVNWPMADRSPSKQGIPIYHLGAGNPKSMRSNFKNRDIFGFLVEKVSF